MPDAAASAVTVVAAEGSTIVIPVLNELIWGTFSFLVFLFFMYRYVWPRLSSTLKERSEGIEGKLEKAERDRAEAQQLLEQYRRQLEEARSEAARIRTDAQSQRQQIVDEARNEARDEAQNVLRRGEEQLQTQRQQVVSELRGEIGRLAVDLAGRVVGESLQDEDRQRRTVDRFLDELDSQQRQQPAGQS